MSLVAIAFDFRFGIQKVSAKLGWGDSMAEGWSALTGDIEGAKASFMTQKTPIASIALKIVRN